MIVQGFVQKDALAASVHSYLRQRQAQQYLKKYIYIYKLRETLSMSNVEPMWPKTFVIQQSV
jgi:hypothetical protein